MATLRDTFHDIAEAIRAKGVSGTFKPIEMAQKIVEIQTGSGSEDYGYLTFTAQEASTLKIENTGNIEFPKLLKSTDAVNWEIWNNPDTNTISLSSGQSIYIKAADDASQRMATSKTIYNKFATTGKIQMSGDIRSIVRLVAPANYSYWLAQLFYSCSSLTKAPELPATTLADSCYNGMFFYCSSLKRIKMNASSGSWGNNMFNYCTSLELVDMTGSIGVPQLQNVNNFSNTNDTYKIVVPDSLYDTWIAATNWASIASHIMKQSDWNAAHPDDQL